MTGPAHDSAEPPSVVLLLHCPLRLGLAADLTHFVYNQGGRIRSHEQYVDAEIRHYYTRLAWDLSEVTMTEGQMAARLQELIGEDEETEWSLHHSNVVPRMAVFVSREPWCLYDLLARASSGEWKVAVPVIVGNHPH